MRDFHGFSSQPCLISRAAEGKSPIFGGEKKISIHVDLMSDQLAGHMLDQAERAVSHGRFREQAEQGERMVSFNQIWIDLGS